MKKFNLEAALAGEKAISKDGGYVEIVYNGLTCDYPLIGVETNASGEKSLKTYTLDGRWLIGEASALTMAPKTVTKWYNLYKHGTYGYHDSEKEANNMAGSNRLEIRSITWEE